MRYVSTRGLAADAGFAEVLLGGLAPDGGLYQPAGWPRLEPGELADLAGRPYAHLAARVLGLFIGEAIDSGTLENLCEAAYAGFGHPAVTPLRQLDADRWLLELFHGPSLAFKDIALQLLARLCDHLLEREGRTATIVCATSGDTGGAAVEAFRGRQRIRLVTLFPQGRISEIQRRFITTAPEENVRAFAVAGDFDDCQALVKALFADPDFARRVGLMAVNSINFVRIAAQSVYYLAAGLALGAPARPVSFAVPSGNFGDAYAGWTARRLGLPVERILVATNVNDILVRALSSGVYRRERLTPTLSPAMDIQSASNFERLVFETTGRDAAATRAFFEAFSQAGEVQLPTQAREAIGDLFVGVSADESQTTAAIARTLTASGELIDPHTAVALSALDRASKPGRGPWVSLATAHPAKFPDTVLAASGRAPDLPAAAQRVAAARERFEALPADLGALRAAVEAFAL